MQALLQQREQYQQALGQLGNQLLAGISRFQNVNWEQLKENDPIEYMTKRDEFREEQEKIKGHTGTPSAGQGTTASRYAKGAG